MNVRNRQEAIIRTLRRSSSSTIAELAAEVSASRRTLIRDIGALRDQGFVIWSEPGRGGGLQLDTRSVLTTPRLTVTEVFALLISVATMRAAGNYPFSSLADAGLSKIEKGLPPDKIRDLRLFLDCLYIGKLAPQIDTSNIGPLDPALLPEFETAFLQRQYLRFDYRDAKGNPSTREVEAQAILILPPLWYLVAWDPDRTDFRHFRMDRISNPQCAPGRTFRKRRVVFDDSVRPLDHSSG